MTTQLHQILAVEKGVKSKANRDLTDAYHRIQRQPLITGIERNYQPREDGGDQLPPESTRVQVVAEQELRSTTEALTRLFDVTLTKDFSNTLAKADVTLPNGRVILGLAPVTYLLWLDKQLTDLRTTIQHLPVLDPARVWTWNENAGAYASEAVETTKTRKNQRPLVLAPATDKHPAQVQLITEDVLAGTWTTVNFSGAVPGDRKEQLLARVETLIEAVKYAREKANTLEVEDEHVGAEIFGYIFE